MEGIKSGLFCIMRRYLKANNKYMINYDSNKETIFLIPVDANNLYDYAMQFKLLYKGFKWCLEEELDSLKENILNLPDDNNIGYILKVDLDYPKELHDKHNDYSFFPIDKEIKYNDLSPYQKDLIQNKSNSTSLDVKELLNKQNLDENACKPKDSKNLT